jgi:pSer/pThr/pTyr-binding forkhead associated (FHA) protein
VTDSRSTNGTWINGQRMAEADVVVGDEIAIACTHRFRLDGSAD